MRVRDRDKCGLQAGWMLRALGSLVLERHRGQRLDLGELPERARTSRSGPNQREALLAVRRRPLGARMLDFTAQYGSDSNHYPGGRGRCG